MLGYWVRDYQWSVRAHLPSDLLCYSCSLHVSLPQLSFLISLISGYSFVLLPACAPYISCPLPQIPHVKIGPEETPRLPYLRFASVSLYPSNEDLSLAVGAILKSFSYPSASLLCAKAECKHIFLCKGVAGRRGQCVSISASWLIQSFSAPVGWCVWRPDLIHMHDSLCASLMAHSCEHSSRVTTAYHCYMLARLIGWPGWTWISPHAIGRAVMLICHPGLTGVFWLAGGCVWEVDSGTTHSGVVVRGSCGFASHLLAGNERVAMEAGQVFAQLSI